MRNINNSDNRINVDNRNYSVIARFRQEDDATLVVNLYKNSSEFDVSNQTVTLRALRADNQCINQTDNISKNKNIVTINFRRNILSVVGKTSIQLNISDSAGQFTTAEFFIEVEKNNLGADVLKGSDNVQALQQILIDFKKEKNSLIKNITDDYNSLKKIIISQNQAADLQNQINQNKQQSVENTTRIEQLEDLTPVWQEHEGIGDITVNDSFDGVTKDLVIKGRTLKNIVNNGKADNVTITKGYYKSWRGDFALKQNTRYTIWYNQKTLSTDKNIEEEFRATAVVFYTDGSYSEHTVQNNNRAAFTTNDKSISHVEWRVGRIYSTHTTQFNYELICLEGDYTAVGSKPFTSYFDSITSCGEQEDNKIKLKSVGKNLFDKNKLVNGEFVTYKGVECYKYKDNPDFFKYIDTFKDNTQYTFTARIYRDEGKEDKGVNIYFVYTDGTFDSSTNNAGEVIKRTSQKGKTVAYIRGSYNHSHIAYLDLSIFQIEENTVATNYEQYRSKLIEIPLPFAKGLKNLPNGTYDEVKEGETIQRVGVKILDGTENWVVGSWNNSNIISFDLKNLSNMKSNHSINNRICDKFLCLPRTSVSSDISMITECITGAENAIYLAINKSRLETQNVEGLKKWLQRNPTTLYYELNEPIVHRLNQDINLSTFDTTTHIIQENNIISDISFKAKISLSSQAKRLKEANRILKEENVSLKESSIKTTEEQEVQDQKITTTMLANTELFEMMLNFMPMQLDDKQFRGGEMNMVEVYVTLIIQGDKTLEQVPAIIKPQVEAKLRLLGVIS